MDNTSRYLIIVIGLLVISYVFLKIIFVRQEKAKRLAEQVFNEQKTTKSAKKQKNAIFSVLNNLSKVFYKLFFFLNWCFKTVKPVTAKKNRDPAGFNW